MTDILARQRRAACQVFGLVKAREEEVYRAHNRNIFFDIYCDILSGNIYSKLLLAILSDMFVIVCVLVAVSVCLCLWLCACGCVLCLCVVFVCVLWLCAVVVRCGCVLWMCRCGPTQHTHRGQQAHRKPLHTRAEHVGL